MDGNKNDDSTMIKSPQILSCPHCEASLKVRALGQMMTIICDSCASVVDISSNENLKILTRFSKDFLGKPLIPLGQRGKLKGIEWEVIGFMRRCDHQHPIYYWDEYLLFNPIRGFRWLTEFDGHWNYVVTTKASPTISHGSFVNKKASYLGKNYQLFHKGQSRVTEVIGEFYWRVKVGELTYIEDYISPPEILSSEKDEKNEMSWSLGEYITVGEIKKAFGQQLNLPDPKGVSPTQVSSFTSLIPFFTQCGLICFGVLFFLQLSMMVISKNELIFEWNQNFKTIDSDKLIISPSFEVKNGPTALEFELASKVQNNWLEIKVDLVHEQTNTIQEFEQGVEYYSGFNGAYESEGNQFHRIILSSISSGTYHLNVQAKTGYSLTQSTSFFGGDSGLPYRIRIHKDVMSWDNLWLAMVLICIVPLVLFWRNRKFEQSRWSSSDFSPFWSFNDNE